MQHKFILIAGLIASVSFGCKSTTVKPSAQKPQTAPPVPVPNQQSKNVATQNVPPPRMPTSPAKELQNQIACTRDKDMRTIRTEVLSPKGCKLWYPTNDGKEPVAWSSVGSSHCDAVTQSIRNKLEAAGFKCASSENVAADSGISSGQKMPSPSGTETLAQKPALNAKTVPAVSTPAAAPGAPPVKTEGQSAPAQKQ